MKKLIFKIGVFLFLLLGGLSMLESIFIEYRRGSTSSVLSFLKAPRGSVEVLMLGSSHFWKGIDPVVFETKTDKKTEMIIGTDIGIDQVYWNLKKALEFQNPETVVLDTWPLVTPNPYSNYINERYYPLRFITGSHLGIQIESELEQNFVVGRSHLSWYQLFDMIRYHDFWTKEEMYPSFLSYSKDNDPKRNFKRTQLNKSKLTDAMVRQFAQTDFEAEELFISEDELFYLQKIIELSREFNFDLLFVSVPVYSEYFQKTKEGFGRIKSTLDSIVEQNENIQFYNLNYLEEGYDRSFIFNEKQVSFNQHLNYRGIVRATTSVANYYNGKADKVDSVRMKMENLVLYSGNIKSDTIFRGAAESVNNKPYKFSSTKNLLTFNENTEALKIRGWMQLTGKMEEELNFYVALKNEDGEIHLAQATLTENEQAKSDPRKAQRQYFTALFTTDMLSNSEYKIYNLIEAAQGTVYIMDPWKWVAIK